MGVASERVVQFSVGSKVLAEHKLFLPRSFPLLPPAAGFLLWRVRVQGCHMWLQGGWANQGSMRMEYVRSVESLRTNQTPLVPYIAYVVAHPNTLYLHDADPSFLQAIGNCPLYRRRTTILWEKRGMYIKFTTWPKAFEDFVGDELSERCHDEKCLIREWARVVGSRM